MKSTSVVLPGVSGFRLLPAVAELGAHGLAAQQLLVAAHVQRRRIEHALVGPPGIFRVGIVFRIDVDQLHVEVGVGAGAGDLELRRDGAGDGDVFGQHVGLVDQHVGPVAGEALVVHHVALRHGVGGVSDEGHGMRRVADVASRTASASVGGSKLSLPSAWK